MTAKAKETDNHHEGLTREATKVAHIAVHTWSNITSLRTGIDRRNPVYFTAESSARIIVNASSCCVRKSSVPALIESGFKYLLKLTSYVEYA